MSISSESVAAIVPLTCKDEKHRRERKQRTAGNALDLKCDTCNLDTLVCKFFINCA
jgi:hypothetical protein